LAKMLRISIYSKYVLGQLTFDPDEFLLGSSVQPGILNRIPEIGSDSRLTGRFVTRDTKTAILAEMLAWTDDDLRRLGIGSAYDLGTGEAPTAAGLLLQDHPELDESVFSLAVANEHLLKDERRIQEELFTESHAFRQVFPNLRLEKDRINN